MRLHRFYIEEKLAGRNEISIADEPLLHQLKDVFRLKKGDRVIFFDGKGIDVTFVIEMISKKEAMFIKESEIKSKMPERNITLCMALIKKDNFELVLQKCTEIGISRFIPIIAERSEKKNIDMDRARRIIKEAAEQCGRGDLPELLEIKNLEDTLDEKDLILFDASGIALSDSERRRIFDGQVEAVASGRALADPRTSRNSFSRRISLLIGPEGGWSEKELVKFKEKKISIYSLGNLTLRAETAAIVAAAHLLI